MPDFGIVNFVRNRKRTEMSNPVKNKGANIQSVSANKRNSYQPIDGENSEKGASSALKGVNPAVPTAEEQDQGLRSFLAFCKQNTYTIITLYLVIFLNIFVVASTSSYFPVVAISDHNQTIFSSTVMMSTISVMTVILPTLFKMSVDIFGRNKNFFLAIFLTGVSQAARSAIVTLDGSSFFVAGVIINMVQGTGLVAQLQVTLSIISSDFKRFVTYFMAMQEICSCLGAGFGPIFGAYIHAELGFVWANLIPGMITIALLVYVVLVLSEHPLDSQSNHQENKEKSGTIRNEAYQAEIDKVSPEDITDTTETILVRDQISVESKRQSEEEVTSPLLPQRNVLARNFKWENMDSYISLFFAAVTMATGFSLGVCFNTTIAIYAKQQFGATALSASYFIFTYYGTAIFFPIIVGPLCDKYNVHEYALIAGHLFAIPALILIGPTKHIGLDPSPTLTTFATVLLAAGSVALTLPFFKLVYRIAAVQGWTLNKKLTQNATVLYLTIYSLGNLVGPVVAAHLNGTIGFAETNFYSAFVLVFYLPFNLFTFFNLRSKEEKLRKRSQK